MTETLTCANCSTQFDESDVIWDEDTNPFCSSDCMREHERERAADRAESIAEAYS